MIPCGTTTSELEDEPLDLAEGSGSNVCYKDMEDIYTVLLSLLLESWIAFDGSSHSYHFEVPIVLDLVQTSLKDLDTERA